MNDAWYIIDPVLIQIGPLAVHWYGFMYGIGLLITYCWVHYSDLGKELKLNSEQKDNLVIYSMLALVIGGRLGYILFYDLAYYIANPLKIFAVWEGGMSFHGGLIGIILMLFYLSKKYKIAFLKISDLICSIAPLGLFFGRIGNFINGELYGRIAENFCLYFPTDPDNCRYPSQLFEALFEGLAIFFILFIIRKFTKKDGIISGSFLLLYGIFRSVIEFFREPDTQIGYILGIFTQGQLLSSLMIVCGIIILIKLLRRN